MNKKILIVVLVVVGSFGGYLLETYITKEPEVFYLWGAVLGGGVGYLMNE